MLSVIILCRNERLHIEACVRSILGQDRPTEGMEVIVVDGLSDDGTREILESLAKQHPELRVVDNPLRITPCAMNAGIRAARGKYIAILGGHCEYAQDFLKTCVDLLHERPEAACTGGPTVSQGRSVFGQAVALAMTHPAGVGNAKHRHPTYEGYAEMACYPVFRKEVFEKVGLYDERFIRNQDDELCYRLAIHGEKVFISPRARYTYFIRETPLKLFRQYFEYGYWRVAVLRKHCRPASLRQLVPPLFMFAVVAGAILGMMMQSWWKLTALALPVVYGAALLGIGLWEFRKAGWRVAVLFPVAAATMVIAYATGFMWGLIKNPVRAEPNEFANKGEGHAFPS